MASHSFPGLYNGDKDQQRFLDKLDQKIKKDALCRTSISPKVNVGKTFKTAVPSIVIHNGSPTITCHSIKDDISTGRGKNKNSGRELRRYMMSLGDETGVSQHGPTMNSIPTSQRPLNCSPLQSSVASTVALPVKQNSLPTLPSGNRGINKSGPVNRMKVDRSLSKQDGFDAEDGAPPNMPRVRANPKVKVLQRSHAMREETSPPRESELSHFTSNIINTSEKINVHKTVNGIHTNSSGKIGSTSAKSGYQGGNSLQVSSNLNRPNSRHKLRHQGSSQGSADSSSPSLSRDSSTEQYTDNSGIDLSQFIADTINKNNKDRMLLLQIEQDLLTLQKDPKRAYHKFPVMPSYQRMLVHRVAAFFGMDHNVDQTGSCVIVNVTPSTRIPDIRFSDLIRQDGKFSEEPRRCILKRDSNSFEEGAQIRSPERQLSGDSRRSKSFEEREEEYERARKRIFNRDEGGSNSSYRSRDGNSRRSSHEDLRWQGDGQPWSSSDSELCNSKGRPNPGSRSSRITKVESFEGHDTLKANSLKGYVSKSYSFGGYPGMSRADSVSSGSSRALMKQDSVTSSVSSARLSPSSSGYKSQSARSDATASNRSSPNQATSQCSFSSEPNTVLWAVSSISAVPPGAVLINPASGQPYTNPDGSLYRYDPENPIKLCPTIEEDITSVSSPTTVTSASEVQCSELVIAEKAIAVSGVVHNTEDSSKVTSNKPEMSLRNSSTSPSLPEPPATETSAPKVGSKHSDATSGENGKRKGNLRVPFENSQNNTESVQTHDNCPSNSNNSNNNNISSNNNNDNNTVNNNNNNAVSNNSSNKNNNNNTSNSVNSISNEVAQTNFNVIESENGFNDNDANSSCQNESRESSGRNNAVTYHMNYASNCNVQGDYGSQPTNGGAYANSSVGVTSFNYTVGPQYPAESLHMPPEAAMYSQQVIYGSSGQSNPYGVVHTAASAPVPNYETRSNENNPTIGVPELGNYFMGINVSSEQAPPSATPAPQYGYWSPTPSTSQTQGSNHSSQIQVYYVPGSVSASTIHPKYTPAAPSMYTYNVPPMVYPTDICQSVMPSATNAVFPAPYYPSASNTTISYRAPTPPTPTAVAATAVAPTSFFLYHPQPAAPPPPPVQFGMVRPQQQVPGIRSSPPPGPRTRIPHARSMSERARHAPVNVDPKASNLHFSSPLSVYGLRFMPGEIQSIGMVRPVGNTRPVVPNSSHPQYAVTPQSYGSDSLITNTRPPRPRKQR